MDHQANVHPIRVAPEHNREITVGSHSNQLRLTVSLVAVYLLSHNFHYSSGQHYQIAAV